MANCVIKIRCGKCKNKWEIYWRDIKADNANICPYCGNEIDRTLWNRDVARAASAALDCNMEIQKDSTGYNKPGFNINFLNRKDS